MYPEISILPVVMSHEEASEVANEFPSVISLVHSSHPLLVSHKNRLLQPFDDEIAPNGRRSCTLQDVSEILKFSKKAPDQILVHCEYGQSRSTAVALGILASRGYDLAYSYEILLQEHAPYRPFTPNILVLSLFDKTLKLKGELLRIGSSWCHY